MSKTKARTKKLRPKHAEAAGPVGVAESETARADNGAGGRGRAVDEPGRGGVLARFGLSKGEAVLLLALMSAAFVFRLWMSLREHDVLWDGYYYGLLGKNLIRGNWEEGLSTYWSPLYPLLVGVSSLFFSDLKFAASFVSVLAGTLLVAAVYFLAREFYGREAAGAGAALAVVQPQLVLYSSVFLTEATYTLLFVCGILAGWLALRRRRAAHSLAAGLLFGACYLVKPEAFAYAGLMVAVALVAAFLRRELLTKKTLSNVAPLLLGFALLSAPYLLYLRGQTGRWTLSEKMDMHLHGAVNIYRLTPDGEGTLADRLWVGRRLGAGGDGAAQAGMEGGGRAAAAERRQSFAKRPAGGSELPVAARLTANLPKEFTTLLKVVPLPLVLLALCGLAAPPWTRERAAKEVYLSLFLLSTLAGYALTTSVNEGRLLVPVMPVFVCWWARAVVVIEEWMARRGAGGTARRGRLMLRVALTATLCVLLAPSIVGTLGRGLRGGQGREAVGRWLKENSGGRAPVVVAAGPWAAFYADGRHLFLPLEPYATVADYARRKRADFLVVEEDTMNPHLRFLWQPGGEQQAAADLTPVHRYEDDRPGHRIVVYKINRVTRDG